MFGEVEDRVVGRKTGREVCIKGKEGGKRVLSIRVMG